MNNEERNDEPSLTAEDLTRAGWIHTVNGWSDGSGELFSFEEAVRHDEKRRSKIGKLPKHRSAKDVWI